jgi:D-sedoheptulose 7-phosphate isomerase/D-glycero-D-manno-heptose 1,7-bisphosphate phosphatase
MNRPGVLLDRDGTIIVDSGYVGSVDRVEFIDGAIDAIAALNRAGLPVAVVTNQAGVARGLFDIEDVNQVHKHMIEEMARHGAHVDLWLFCPYHPDGSVNSFARASSDRKPGPGMALAAAEALSLDLAHSWVVGDSVGDVGLARAVGARPVHVGPVAFPAPDVLSFPHLAAAARHIVDDHTQGASTARPSFPTYQYPDGGAFGSAYATELGRALASVDVAQISKAGELLTQAYVRDASVFVCGNGGSASIANHFQCDHVKGVGNGTDLSPRVSSLSSNVELLSAIANDHGYETVFEFQLRSAVRPGDALIVVSSSGRSPNIVRALKWANQHGMPSIAFTGFSGGAARELASASVHVDSSNYGIVEDAHQACMHLLAQYVRQSRMTAADVVATTF